MLKERTINLITSLPALVSAIASFSLALSIANELGLLMQIDSRLVSFLSIQDIVVNALTYVPIAVFCLLAGNFLAAIYRPSGVLFKFYLSASKHPWLDATAYILGCLSFFLFVDNWPLAILGYTLLCYGTWVAWVGTRTSRGNHFIAQQVSQVILFIVLAFLAGASQALYVLSYPPGAYEITLVDEQPFKSSIIFSGNNYLLLRDKSDSVRIIAQDRVREIEILNIHPPVARYSLRSIWDTLL